MGNDFSLFELKKKMFKTVKVKVQAQKTRILHKITKMHKK